MRCSLLIFLLWTLAAQGTDLSLNPGLDPGLDPAMVSSLDAGRGLTPPGLAGCPVPALPQFKLPAALANTDIVQVLTNNMEADLNGLSLFKAATVLRQGTREVSAESGSYNRQTGEFLTNGPLEFYDGDSRVRGATARFNTQTGIFSITDADYDLYGIPARGTAALLTREKEQELLFKQVTYTSCPQGTDDWVLRTGDLRIDQATGVATAHDAWLDFKGVSILYTPYLTYPIDNRRKSGLLLPDLGSSAGRGLEYAQPYYFNLATNYDLTLTPRYMSQLGLETQSEFRYLKAGTRGFITADFLPNDKLTGENRGQVSWINQSNLPKGFRATVAATVVSDSTYFEDLTSGVANTSQTNVTQQVALEWTNKTWIGQLRVANFTTLDEDILEENKPYRMIPQLSINGYWPRAPLGLTAGVDSEFTYFDRDLGVTGFRAHLLPAVSLPLQWGAFQLEPSAGLDYTGYALKNETPGTDPTPSRTLPVYSLDIRTLLETFWGQNASLLQTLEPRVQFVHVPFEEQSTLPVFDTIQPDFNLVQLFRKNRYIGLDRLGDTDQLNIGITSRLIRSRDGSQFLTATVGGTRYFGTQQVLLPDELASDYSSSDYIAELGMNISQQWQVDMGYQWDAEGSSTQLAEARLQYRPDDYRLLNLAYRFRRDSVREVDVGGTWPLLEHWSAVARLDYSLQDHQPLESFFGIEYSSCCWGLRLVTHHYLVSRDGAGNTDITLQLILKGFGSPRNPTGQQLSRGILNTSNFDRY